MKNEEEKLLQEVNERKKGSRRPESQKIAAVCDLESGNYTGLQVMEKYKILADTSLLDWCQIYAADKSKYLRKKRHKEATKRKAVHEIESGLLSIEQVVKKYDMSKSRIKHWIKEYPVEIDVDKKENLSLPSESNYNLMRSEKRSAKEKELEAALKAAQLKILGLETMIEVAETELNISIRKKSGTKQ
jgi:transposase